MPIMIEELHTRIRPEQEAGQGEHGSAASAAESGPGPAPDAALAEQIQRELRLREERRLRWQAD